MKLSANDDLKNVKRTQETVRSRDNEQKENRNSNDLSSNSVVKISSCGAIAEVDDSLTLTSAGRVNSSVIEGSAVR